MYNQSSRSCFNYSFSSHFPHIGGFDKMYENDLVWAYYKFNLHSSTEIRKAIRV